jgi:tetratricopeptide (TPR) repeat protein
VLETEQDYARFGIERRALADILTVGPQGIAFLHRTEIAAPNARDVPVPAEAAKGSLPAKSRSLDRNEDAIHPVAKKEIAADDFDGGGEHPLEETGRGRASAPRPISPRAVRREMTDAMDDLIGAAAPAPMHAPLPAPPRPAAAAAPSGSFGRAATGGAALQASRERAGGVWSPAAEPPPPSVSDIPPATGPLKDVLDRIAAGRAGQALSLARAWRERDPADVLALVALGEAWEALGDTAAAARAYGSIIDLFPGRADLRRFAGERLERVRSAAALALAIDTFRQAVEQRPDHPASHRLLGFALLKAGHPREAFEAIAIGAAQKYPAGRFAGVDRILREDLGLAAAAWIRVEPARAREIEARLAQAGGAAETAPSLRFVLNWETDANDVDFHIEDAKGGHAYYAAPHLPSGGELYADVTTGYGPECFTIRGPAATRAAPYRLQAHYFSRGPMGYGMGKLEIIEHDGRGNLRFDERPFVIMQDGAFVDLGSVGAGHIPEPLASARAGKVLQARP